MRETYSSARRCTMPLTAAMLPAQLQQVLVSTHTHICVCCVGTTAREITACRNTNVMLRSEHAMHDQCHLVLLLGHQDPIPFIWAEQTLCSHR